MYEKWKRIRYWAVETYRYRGGEWFFWRGVILLLVLWALWPEPAAQERHALTTPQKPGVQPHQEVAAPKLEPAAWQQTPEVETNLREKMTTTQKAFYWESFNWMMEYGAPLQPRAFESNTLKLLLVADARFPLEEEQNSPVCRLFREKLVIGTRANTRLGAACQQAKGQWCKQLQGEPMQCRYKPAEGFEAWKNRTFDMHNFKIKLNRSLSNLPGF